MEFQWNIEKEKRRNYKASNKRSGRKRKSIKKDILAFSNDVSHYAENKMAMSFTDLYKVSAPIILLCGLVSLVFYKGKFRVGRRRKGLTSKGW